MEFIEVDKKIIDLESLIDKQNRNLSLQFTIFEKLNENSESKTIQLRHVIEKLHDSYQESCRKIDSWANRKFSHSKIRLNKKAPQSEHNEEFPAQNLKVNPRDMCMEYFLNQKPPNKEFMECVDDQHRKSIQIHRPLIHRKWAEIQQVEDYPTKIQIFRSLLWEMNISIGDVWQVLLFRLNNSIVAFFDVLAQRVLDFKHNIQYLKQDFDHKHYFPVRKDHLDIPFSIVQQNNFEKCFDYKHNKLKPVKFTKSLEQIQGAKQPEQVVTKFGKDERKRFLCELHAFEWDWYLNKYKFSKNIWWKNRFIMDRINMPFHEFEQWIQNDVSYKRRLEKQDSSERSRRLDRQHDLRRKFYYVRCQIREWNFFRLYRGYRQIKDWNLLGFGETQWNAYQAMYDESTKNDIDFIDFKYDVEIQQNVYLKEQRPIKPELYPFEQTQTVTDSLLYTKMGQHNTESFSELAQQKEKFEIIIFRKWQQLSDQMVCALFRTAVQDGGNFEKCYTVISGLFCRDPTMTYEKDQMDQISNLEKAGNRNFEYIRNTYSFDANKGFDNQFMNNTVVSNKLNCKIDQVEFNYENCLNAKQSCGDLSIPITLQKLILTKFNIYLNQFGKGKVYFSEMINTQKLAAHSESDYEQQVLATGPAFSDFFIDGKGKTRKATTNVISTNASQQDQFSEKTQELLQYQLKAELEKIRNYFIEVNVDKLKKIHKAMDMNNLTQRNLEQQFLNLCDCTHIKKLDKIINLMIKIYYQSVFGQEDTNILNKLQKPPNIYLAIDLLFFDKLFFSHKNQIESVSQFRHTARDHKQRQLIVPFKNNDYFCDIYISQSQCSFVWCRSTIQTDLDEDIDLNEFPQTWSQQYYGLINTTSIIQYAIASIDNGILNFENIFKLNNEDLDLNRQLHTHFANLQVE